MYISMCTSKSTTIINGNRWDNNFKIADTAS